MLFTFALFLAQPPTPICLQPSRIVKLCAILVFIANLRDLAQI